MHRLLSSVHLSSTVVMGTAFGASALPLSAAPQADSGIEKVHAPAIPIMPTAVPAADTASIAECVVPASGSSWATAIAGTTAGTGTAGTRYWD